MTCLRAARAQGVLPGFDQALQEGLVPLPLLQLALLHKHHQVSSYSRNSNRRSTNNCSNSRSSSSSNNNSNSNGGSTNSSSIVIGLLSL